MRGNAGRAPSLGRSGSRAIGVVSRRFPKGALYEALSRLHPHGCRGRWPRDGPAFRPGRVRRHTRRRQARPRRPAVRQPVSLCADVHGTLNGYYVGHDEPSLEFKSNLPGSGNNMTYVVTLPKDPTVQPTASGAPGSTTWNFELRPTFWFGLTLCDSESAPEYTKRCKPDSDSNNLVGTNPKAANYIGKHPVTRSWSCSSTPRLRGAVRRLWLHGHAVLRGDDDRQPHSRPEQRCPRIDRHREHRGMQQLRPRRPRADQLGVDHAEWTLAGTRESSVHRDVVEPELRGG